MVKVYKSFINSFLTERSSLTFNLGNRSGEGMTVGDIYVIKMAAASSTIQNVFSKNERVCFLNIKCITASSFFTRARASSFV